MGTTEGEPYYYRGLINLSNGKTEDGLADLSKAGELGFLAAYEKIKEFDRTLSSPPEAGKESNRTDISERSFYIRQYLDAVKELRRTKPTLRELNEYSKRSTKTWSFRLRDKYFLIDLRKAVLDRQSKKYSKTDESKNFWIEALAAVDDWIAKSIIRKDPLSRKANLRYDDNKRVDDPYADINDAIDEDTSGRNTERKDAQDK